MNSHKWGIIKAISKSMAYQKLYFRPTSPPGIEVEATLFQKWNNFVDQLKKWVFEVEYILYFQNFL